MAVTIIATPGDPSANSYETLVEYQAYLANRLQLPAAVAALLVADPDEKLAKSLLMGTRALDSVLTKHKRLEVNLSRGGVDKYYIVSSYWTGTPATTTQALAWPRNGMFDRNGNAIAPSINPQELKDAESEFSILALTSDLTADNAAIVAGLTDLKAGPVELQFKEYVQLRTLPQSVIFSLIPSWYTDEAYESIPQARFQNIGLRRCW